MDFKTRLINILETAQNHIGTDGQIETRSLLVSQYGLSPDYAGAIVDVVSVLPRNTSYRRGH